MSRGDDQYNVFFVAGDTTKPEIAIPTANPIPECCCILPLFGNSDYVANPDEFKQDETGYFNYYDGSVIDAVTLIIQKCKSDGTFEDKHTVTDNTYGTYKALGDEIINGLEYISITNINWSKVLVDFGAGVYRIKTNEVNIFPSEDDQNAYSFQYDLQEFTEDRADKTVFFKVLNSGSMGDRLDGTKTFAFPSDWSDGMRLPGSFGYDFSDYEKTYHKLNSGLRQHTETKRTPKYMFKGLPIGEDARKYFENELMLADFVEITDYNKNAANTHIKTPVHGSGEYSPTYPPSTSKAFFDVEFTHAYDNYIKKHCIT